MEYILKKHQIFQPSKIQLFFAFLFVLVIGDLKNTQYISKSLQDIFNSVKIWVNIIIPKIVMFCLFEKWEQNCIFVIFFSLMFGIINWEYFIYEKSIV